MNSFGIVTHGCRESSAKEGISTQSGGTVGDGSMKLYWSNVGILVAAFAQYEKWLAPILAPAGQTNWTASVDITFWRHSWVGK
jgi:hypothetical protein